MTAIVININMIELVSAKEVLELIFEENLPFKVAIKKVFSNAKEGSEFVSIVSGLVGCELRHHLLFRQYVYQHSSELTNDQKYFVYLYLANKFFYKRLDLNKSKDYIFNSVLNGTNEALLADDIPDSFQLLDSLNIDHNKVEFVSIRFNTPKWLMKMWTKHYGKSIVFKLLKKNSKPAEQFYRVNTIHENYKDVLNDNRFFEKTSVENVLKIKSGVHPKNVKYIANNDVLSLKLPIKIICDENFDQFLDEVSIYSGENDQLVKELLVQSNKRTGLNVIVPDLSERAEIYRQIRIEKAKNINLFQANDAIGISSGVSKKQDVFFVMPKSSSLDRIRKFPDYLVHFKPETLDALIREQYNILNDVSNFINEEGKIVYIVDTLNKKESTLQIEKFLNEHKDFKLLQEKQFFSFDEEDACFYYAILQLKGKEND